MITTLEGTRRFVVKRALSPEPDVYASLPKDFTDTIREVHLAGDADPDNIGKVGAYSVNLDEEFEAKFARASNLLEMVAVDSRNLDERLDHTTSEEISPMRDFLEPLDPDTLGTPDALGTSERFWRLGTVTDQGREGACVGHAGTSFLTNSPLRSHAKKSTSWLNDFAKELYDTCRKNDEWPGENYSGTSVSALMKVLMARGLISAAVVTQSFDEIVRWKREKGPLVISAPWYEGCYVTDAGGFIRPTGNKVGGHALLDAGISRWMSAQWKNSWGLRFGMKGVGYVAERDYRWWLSAGLRAYGTVQTKK